MDPVRKIQCSVHGEQDETFVCQHIVHGLHDGKSYGFYWANDSENPRPDAWCTICNEKSASCNGEWTEEAVKFALPALLCGSCYDKAKAMNLFPKKWWELWK